MVHIEKIKYFFRGRIALHEQLNRYTSFQIGGPADYYLEPADKEDVVRIVRYLKEQEIPFMMMGRGSNMLVSDEGVRGAVINFETGLKGVRLEGDRVVVEAGVGLARFVDFCIQHALAGVEMLPGIPGTVGGAIMMNAGAYGGEISDHLVDVEVLRGAEVTIVPKEQAGFRYRHSGFQNDIILGASFRLPPGDKAAIMKRRRELLLKRNETQPLNMPNSGSMFKNPPGTYAARLIEEAGLKGATRGQSQISEKHANFFLNLGGATANDVLQLIRLARETVMKKFGISMELEIKLVGFPEEVQRGTGA